MQRLGRPAPKLKLTIKEMCVDEKALPVARAVAECKLTPMSGMVVEDGDYILRYTFDGEQEEHRVRVENGILLAR